MKGKKKKEKRRRFAACLLKQMQQPVKHEPCEPAESHVHTTKLQPKRAHARAHAHAGFVCLMSFVLTLCSGKFREQSRGGWGGGNDNLQKTKQALVIYLIWAGGYKPPQTPSSASSSSSSALPQLLFPFYPPFTLFFPPFFCTCSSSFAHSPFSLCVVPLKGNKDEIAEFYLRLRRFAS